MDKLNDIGRKSIPYDEYFGAMELTDEQKEKRKSMAEEIADIMIFLYSLLEVHSEYNIDVNSSFASSEIKKRYMDVINNIMDDVIVPIHKDEILSYLDRYSNEFAEDIIRSTLENQGDDYYTSNDRAIFVAENEANTCWNFIEYEEAIESGKTRKTWIDKRDNKERNTHLEVGGETIGIDDYFVVGDSLMLFPKDTSMGAEAKEIINCRCTIKYS